MAAKLALREKRAVVKLEVAGTDKEWTADQGDAGVKPKGERGDAMIFVSDVSAAVRIFDGARGEKAPRDDCIK